MRVQKKFLSKTKSRSEPSNHWPVQKTNKGDMRVTCDEFSMRIVAMMQTLYRISYAQLRPGRGGSGMLVQGVAETPSAQRRAFYADLGDPYSDQRMP